VCWRCPRRGRTTANFDLPIGLSHRPRELEDRRHEPKSIALRRFMCGWPRNSNTGGLEVYDIANNQITNAAFIGTVGLEWQFSSRAPKSADA
jgi:hypothetical protein